MKPQQASSSGSERPEHQLDPGTRHTEGSVAVIGLGGTNGGRPAEFGARNTDPKGDPEHAPTREAKREPPCSKPKMGKVAIWTTVRPSLAFCCVTAAATLLRCLDQSGRGLGGLLRWFTFLCCVFSSSCATFSSPLAIFPFKPCLSQPHTITTQIQVLNTRSLLLASSSSTASLSLCFRANDSLS